MPKTTAGESGGVKLIYSARNDAQRKTERDWPNAKIVILIGLAGTGKTTVSLAMAIKDLLAGRSARLMLSRPAMGVEEELGYFPGSVGEKLGPWMAPFADVMGDLSESKLASLGNKLETVPVGMLRGRTVSNATLIIDEAQNATWSQLVCAATRVGRGGRVVLCGDPAQSDLKIPKGQLLPLTKLAYKLARVPGVVVVRCQPSDQVREAFVNEVLKAVEET